MHMGRTSILVIISARNEAANIVRLLHSIHACEQPCINLDIVLVDDGSTDSTVELAKQYGIQVLSRGEKRWKSISQMRNKGAEVTDAELLAFLDADMIVPTDWLTHAISSLKDDEISAIGFVDKVPENAPWVGRIWGNRSYRIHHARKPTDYLPGRNILVTRDAFTAVSGFDETLRTCEDKDFIYRLVQAGYTAIYSPATILTHMGYERSLGEFIRKEFWRQSSTLTFASRHSYSLRTIRNPLISGYHLFCLLALFTTLVFRWTYPALLFSSALVFPSLNICTRFYMKKGPANEVAGLFILELLRWNVSGCALLYQLCRDYFSRGELNR